jgi:hypothetical protein
MSKVSFPKLSSFLSTNDLPESARVWYVMTSVFMTRTLKDSGRNPRCALRADSEGIVRSHPKIDSLVVRQ